MKKLSVIALLLVIAIMPIGIFGCAKADKVTYNVVVTVNNPEDAKSPLINKLSLAIEVDENYVPTVLDVVREACQNAQREFEASEDGLSVVKIGTVKEFDEEGTKDDGTTGVIASSYWTFTLNGAEVKNGRAGNTKVADNDVIEFNFVRDEY